MEYFTFTDEIRLNSVVYTVGYTMEIERFQYVINEPDEIDIDIDYVLAANEAKPNSQVDISMMVSEFVDFDDWLHKRLFQKCRDHRMDALYERSFI